MSQPSTLQDIASQVRREAAEDYVGLWQISRLLRSAVVSSDSTLTDLLHQLLTDGSMDIGQFEGKTFHPWAGTTDSKIARVSSELTKLGRDPDIGEIAWLVLRA
jgi:hypothetical protein